VIGSARQLAFAIKQQVLKWTSVTRGGRYDDLQEKVVGDSGEPTELPTITTVRRASAPLFSERLRRTKQRTTDGLSSFEVSLITATTCAV